MITINIKDALKEAWRNMCHHEGVHANSKFVMFSDDNPFKARYDTLMDLYLRGKTVTRDYSV
jgi:hypothetical protein